MLYLKACPKCGGDLYDANDIYGPYIACLQCGHHLNEAEEHFFLSRNRKLNPSTTQTG